MGRKAAVSIDKYLGGSGIIDEELTRERKIGACVGITAEGFKDEERVKMPCLAPEKVINNFIEVETGLPEDGTIAESKRCLQCGVRSQISPAPRPPAVIDKKSAKPDAIESAA